MLIRFKLKGMTEEQPTTKKKRYRKQYVHSNIVAQEHKHISRAKAIMEFNVGKDMILNHRLTFPENVQLETNIRKNTLNPDRIIITENYFKNTKETYFIYTNNLDYVFKSLYNHETGKEVLFPLSKLELMSQWLCTKKLAYFSNLTKGNKLKYLSNRMKNAVVLVQRNKRIQLLEEKPNELA